MSIPVKRSLVFVSAGHDTWSVAPVDASSVEPVDGLLMGWAQWQAVREQWPSHLRAGVVFRNDGDVADLVPELPRLALVALTFPKWTDGRAYSQARLLRVRHRYTGELRAVGQVIADMSAQLYRTGFDAVALREGESIEVAERMLNRVPVFYQADAKQPRQRFARALHEGAAP